MAKTSVIQLHESPDNQYYLDSIENTNLSLDTNHGAGLIQSKASSLIGEALRSRVDRIDHDNCDAGDEDAFFVADLGEVYRQHMRWKLNLARVKPHFGKNSIPANCPPTNFNSRQM